jgi:hypothetical protein
MKNKIKRKSYSKRNKTFKIESKIRELFQFAYIKQELQSLFRDVVDLKEITKI